MGAIYCGYQAINEMRKIWNPLPQSEQLRDKNSETVLMEPFIGNGREKFSKMRAISYGVSSLALGSFAVLSYLNQATKSTL